MRMSHFIHDKLLTVSIKGISIYFVCIGIIGLWSCERTQYLPSLSTDEDPVISLTNPTTNSTLARPGEQVKVNVLAVDDLALTVFRVKLKVIDENGNEIESSTPIQQELNGLSFSYELAEIIPDQSASTQLIYTFEVIDSKGAVANVDFSIGILARQNPPQFRILSFKDQSLNAKPSGTAFALNFTSRATYPPPATNLLSRDIEENTQNDGSGSFSAKLISPNNAALGRDSVFVMTDASKFNFEEATWLSLYQAYFSSGIFLSETPSLKVDDFVIVRLTKAPAPQFAIMKIRDVVDGAGSTNDYIVFDYKVSSE